jgi:tungstate transport system substrate-binding protein
MMLDWKVALTITLVAVLVVATMGYAFLAQGHEKKTLRLATTTSTFDSGLLDYILPQFEDKYDCEVDVIAVGSGQAMKMGELGDVDVLLVHSPSSEIKFVSDGFGESRTLVMYNNFVIVGPKGDPAETNSSRNTSQAFTKIHDNGTARMAEFISRGDSSGTHTKEISLWTSAGFNASTFSTSWYLSARQGMGAVLDMCEQVNAYTLSDDATYYQRVSANLIPHLNITYQGDPGLFNQYSVIPVNATKWTHINHTLAIDFKDWLVSQGGQDLIAGYEKYGHQLFFPNAPGYASSTLSLRIGEQAGSSSQILADDWIATGRAVALAVSDYTRQ